MDAPAPTAVTGRIALGPVGSRRRATGTALLIGLLAVAPGSAVAAENVSGILTPPRVTYQESPEFPASVDRSALPGTAEIHCQLDDTGAVVAARVTSASRPEFGEAALVAARRWRFEPALLNGRPVARAISIPFVFQPNFTHPLEQALSRAVFVEPGAPPVPAESLPRIPEPIKRAWPRYPEELRGTRTKGSAVLSFVIAPDGRPINPEVISTSHPSFELPALLSVLALQFAPIVDANGKPLWVSMLLRYEFDESMLKEQDKESERRIVVPRSALPPTKVTPASRFIRPPRPPS